MGFRASGRDSQLLAATNLLVYLQFILLFQHKSERRYWMLALLSLMQVSVAAALGLELSFGLLMLAYLVVALTTLVLFCAHREAERYSSSANGSGIALPPASIGTVPPEAIGSRSWLRWTRRQQTVRRVGALQSGRIHASTVSGREPLTGSVARLVAGMTGTTLLVALALFFLIPRAEQDSWARGGGRGTTVTGIPETVSLAEVGTIYESPEEVMKVQFLDPNGENYPLSEPPLFRGFHLSSYRKNRWRQSGESHPVGMGATEMNLAGTMVQQNIDTRPSDSNVMFHVASPTTTRILAGSLLWDEPRQRVLRAGGFRSQYAKYKLANRAFEAGRQSRYVAATWQDAGSRYTYIAFPQSLARLANLSRQIVDGIDPDDRIAQIQQLNEYLTDPRRFAYTLRPTRSDLDVDAVEDFVFNTHKGHCEYFASAMTLMLRSLRIPARMVIGYKGGEFNSYGRFYQVRQLHAHAWVEAYVPYDELPDEVLARNDEWEPGAWYTIDPTPSISADGLPATSAVRFLGIRQLGDYARFLWSSYVMGMDAQRQQRSVYSLPVTTVKAIADPNSWRAAGDWLALFFVPGRDPTGGSGWVILRLVVVGAVGVGLAIAATRFLRRRWPALKRRFARLPRPVRSPPRVETLLYGRLEAALAQHNFHRPEGQTPREFAVAAGGLLSGSRATQGVSQLPLGVVESFYRLRFAGRGLDKRELETLEQSLARLEAALFPADSSQGAMRE